MKFKIFSILFLMTLLISVLFVNNSAHAVSKRVSSPNVTKGELALDLRGSFETGEDDPDALQHNTQITYGLTERLRISADTDFRKTAGRDAEFDNTDLEFRYNFYQTENLRAAFGGAYEFSHVGDNNEIGVSFQGEYRLNQWKHQANLGFEREVGGGAAKGMDFALRTGHYYDLGKVEPGIEYFFDYGNLTDNNGFEEQEHHIGPVINFDINVGEVEFSGVLGYLAGLSNGSADHVFKYEFGYEF